MTAVALETRDLVSGYHNRPVLHGVSLSVAPGSIVGLIGPNGHGKTTLLRTLSGLVTLRSGSIRFGGEDIAGASAHQRVERGLIHVPQGDQLFGDMTVEENLRMGAYLCRSQSQIQRGLEEVYGLFPRLAERRGQSTSSLSGGERRMAGIGRGLMANGSLTMFDEPSLGLAPLIIEQIYRALQSLVQSDRAILIVEENPSRLLGVADRICLLDAGRIQWSGTSREALSSQDVFATYLGQH